MNLKSVVSNIVFVVQLLLIFLLVFESSVRIPTLLQPIGRLHPLVLHFPVVLVILLFLAQFLKRIIEEKSFVIVRDILLYSTALVTSATALMGFFLSMESGYNPDTLGLHKWTGVGLSFVCYGLLIANPGAILYKGLSYASLALILVTGHMGANITHGEDFLLEPVLVKKVEINENTPIYTSLIQPVFDSKCVSCHNPQKKKGKLDMSNWEGLQAGGENGEIWTPGEDQNSELIRRVYLEEDHDDHMPPEGKPQLNDFEVKLIKSWIRIGADSEVSLAKLNQTDTLFQLASFKMEEELQKTMAKTYDFKAAKSSIVEGLNNPYRTVKQNTLGSPALEVNVYVKGAYTSETLSELNKIAEQIVSLNLSYMPVTDEDLNIISSFSNLEKLNLNYTNVSDEGLGSLATLDKIEVLALAGTRISTSPESLISQLESLKTIYLGDTPLKESEIEDLNNKYPVVNIDKGYIPDNDETLLISVPQLANKTNIIAKDEKIEFKHSIPDTRMFYTLDGTAPDTNSTEYFGPFIPETIATIRAIAFKKGWQPSNIEEFAFYIKGYTPTSAKLLNPPNQKYTGHGARALTDNVKGDIESFTAPYWLGYQDKNFDALVDFGDNPPEVEHVVLSYGMNTTSYIMKPVSVSVYGGNSANNLKLIEKIQVKQSTDYEPNMEEGLDVKTGSTSYRYYRVVAEPLRELPEWHIGKGDKGWVFVDELFFY